MKQKTLYITMLTAAGIFWLWAAPAALAHGVHIFAWPQGDKICTESYFKKNSPVKKGQVTMAAADGQQLASQDTDENGQTCFARPSQPQLVFKVQAGAGHAASFSFDNSGPANDIMTQPAQPMTPANNNASPSSLENTAALDVFTNAVRKIVREEKERQVSELWRGMADQQQQSDTPGLKKILYGLGWIIALTAIFYIIGDKKRRRRECISLKAS